MLENAKPEQKLIALLEPVVVENGFELVDIDLATEQGQRVLRVFIDKDSGVNVDDCAQVSGYLEDVLDMQEALTGRYSLEVSSPGLNRPLRTQAHFQKVLGKKVQIVTTEKLDGRKNFKGVLTHLDDNNLTLEIDLQNFVVPLAKISKANLVYTFGAH